ncbi:MAG: hypothetical protein HS107_15550 [Thermoflexaceae bacterium]|nr:hypothetical protein [Thermoflexaceae bacterium]
MSDHLQATSQGGQLSLFQDEGTLPVPGWRGRTPPEMRADAPEGYRLDLSLDEPHYVLDAESPELVGEPIDEPAETLDEGDDDLWFPAREWAPYCGDTIGMSGTIRRPASRLGALWISTGGGGRAIDRDERNTNVFRVVPLAEYRSPHPDLPLHYREHFELPEEHPYRYGYEGVIVTWQKKPHVLTDEHMVFRHPYVPHPQGHGYIPDPEWFPHDEDAVRSERNPWRDDPLAWRPISRML